MTIRVRKSVALILLLFLLTVAKVDAKPLPAAKDSKGEDKATVISLKKENPKTNNITIIMTVPDTKANNLKTIKSETLMEQNPPSSVTTQEKTNKDGKVKGDVSSFLPTEIDIRHENSNTNKSRSEYKTHNQKSSLEVTDTQHKDVSAKAAIANKNVNTTQTMTVHINPNIVGHIQAVNSSTSMKLKDITDSQSNVSEKVKNKNDKYGTALESANLRTKGTKSDNIIPNSLVISIGSEKQDTAVGFSSRKVTNGIKPIAGKGVDNETTKESGIVKDKNISSSAKTNTSVTQIVVNASTVTHHQSNKTTTDNVKTNVKNPEDLKTINTYAEGQTTNVTQVLSTEATTTGEITTLLTTTKKKVASSLVEMCKKIKGKRIPLPPFCRKDLTGWS